VWDLCGGNDLLWRNTRTEEKERSHRAFLFTRRKHNLRWGDEEDGEGSERQKPLGGENRKLGSRGVSYKTPLPPKKKHITNRRKIGNGGRK